MKQFILILIFCLVGAYTAPAQTDSKPFGSKGVTVVDVDTGVDIDTIEITPKYSSQLYTFEADTVNLVVDADSSKAFSGNRLLFKVEASTQTRYVTFGGNLEAPPDSVLADKARVWEFVYVPDRFVLLTRGTEY